MKWYESVIFELDKNQTYTHRYLIEVLKTIKPDLSENTYVWSINNLIRGGYLFRKGYDAYTLPNGRRIPEYRPEYSGLADDLIGIIDTKYPFVSFTVFETVLMNEFLNHLIAQNTVFIQVEKESSIITFRFLQDNGYKNVLYKPDRRDMDLYWARDCIIITDMISEAPIRKDNPHMITLEKMLVDIYADKLISSTFTKAEYPEIIRQAESRYLLDKTRMLRYAGRRNRQKEIAKHFAGGTVNAVS